MLFSNIDPDFDDDDIDYTYLKMDGDEIYPVFIENSWEAQDEKDNPLLFMNVIWRTTGYDDDNKLFDFIKFGRIFLN